MWKGSPQIQSVDCELAHVLSDVLGCRPDRSPALVEVARKEVSIVETLYPSGQLLDIERAADEAARSVVEPPGLSKSASHRNGSARLGGNRDRVPTILGRYPEVVGQGFREYFMRRGCGVLCLRGSHQRVRRIGKGRQAVARGSIEDLIGADNQSGMARRGDGLRVLVARVGKIRSLGKQSGQAVAEPWTNPLQGIAA